MDAADHVQRGREAVARRAWKDAHATLSAAGELGGDDLERLALAAYMLGDEAEYLAVLERAHRAHLQAGAVEPAVRCAFWLGLLLTLRGDAAQASGWLARAQRLPGDRDCVERGYLSLLASLQRGDEGDLAASAEAGQRFGDVDLLAIAVHQQGVVRVGRGDVEAGLPLFDEAMVAVTAGELSPIATGLIYCSVIEGCQQVHELRRAQEWTTALTRWCEQQEDLVAFTGRCLVHRAEIMQVRGAWTEALEEARKAARTLGAAGQAHYRQGELHRLQGDFAAAEQAYREASRCGVEPQPGLAQLRLAQGRRDAAVAAISRVVAEASDPPARTRLLPAQVEILLATGDAEAAVKACDELDALADQMPSRLLGRPPPMPWAPSISPRTTRAPPSALCGPRRSPGRSSTRRTSARGRASSWDVPAGRSATKTPPRSSSRRRARRSRGSARLWTSPGSTVPTPGTGCRHASCRSCGSWRPAGPTGRSPPSWCSASGLSSAT